MPSEKRKLGDIGEKIALNYLKKQDYQILEKNFQRKWGEIDIAAKIKDTIIFIEVKTIDKTKNKKFLPEQNINFFKQKKLLRTAKTYLLEKNLPPDMGWQIDVIAVELDFKTRRAKLRHLKNAIYPEHDEIHR